jgi:parvulin-like peptidyl-prolyl isomerase
MPNLKKSLKSNKSVSKLPETADAKRRKSKTNAIITASAILLVIIIVVVVGWYLVYKAPLQATIIKVNNDSISVDYLIKRCLMNTSDPNDTMSTIQNIIQEELIKQAAPQYGITVTEADIDQELRKEANNSSSGTDSTVSDTATTTTPTETTTPIDTSVTTTATPGTTTPAVTTTLSDAEYQEWYRQTLDATTLSESQFRDLVRTSIIAQRLQTIFEANMPTTAEQAHIYDIVVADSATATDIKNRIDAGEDFQTLASEVSLDTSTKDKGGDMGWVPIKALDSDLANTVTNLEIGKVSDPVQTSSAAQQAASSQQDQPYFLLMVTEKSPSREVDPQYISTLQGRLMTDWLNTQMSTQKISLLGKGSSGGYDSTTDAWIQYQIEKLKASRGITSSTTTTPTDTIPTELPTTTGP